MSILAGDIVEYHDELFRLEDTDHRTCTIVNTMGSKTVDYQDLKFIGRDTISGLQPYGTPTIGVGSWVRHLKQGIVGEVIEIRNNSTIKVESYNSDYNKFVQYFWWLEEVVECSPNQVQTAATKMEKSHSPYGSHGAPGPSSFDWGGEEYRRLTGSRKGRTADSYPPYSGRTGHSSKFEPTTKPKLDISTASLIKKEVSQLEQKAETSSRPLRTSAPTGTPEPASDSSPAIPRRKGEWGSAAPTSKENEPDDEDHTPIAPRKGNW